MAQLPGSFSFGPLTLKEFPPEFEDVYRARTQSSEQGAAEEKVLTAGFDRRKRITVAPDYQLSGDEHSSIVISQHPMGGCKDQDL